MDLSDPAAFERAYDEHARGVYARRLPRPRQRRAGPGRRPGRLPASCGASRGSSTPRRGELGSYLRLMARCRALDLWREGQAAGRASDRLKLVVARDEGRARRAPRRRRRARRASGARVRDALRGLPDGPARGGRARLLGRADGRPDRAALERPARHGQEPHPARAGAPAPRVRAPPCAGELARLACSLQAGGARQRQPVRSASAARLPRRARAAGAGRLVRRPHPHRPERSRRAQGHARGDPRRPRRRRPPARAALRDARARRLPGGQRRRPGRRGRVRGALRGARAHRARTPTDAVAEARRCLEAGARGFKLHPRSDAFGLPHPVVEEVVALAHERRAPGALPRRARDPAPRRGGGRPRAALPGRAPDPGPRRHQRPRLDRRRGGRAATTCSSTPPGGTSPTSCSSTRRSRPGGSSTPATCPTRRACSPPSSSCAWRARSATGPRPCARSPAAQLARIVAGEDPLDLGPGAGPGRRRPARDRGRARGHLLRRRPAGRLPGHGPRPSRSRWRGWRAGRAATATSASC